MKTYKIYVIRKAFHEIVDKSKPVKFTYYRPKQKPLKVKGIINDIRARGQKGLFIQFRNVYINRKSFPSDAGFYTKNIRWITNPFDWEVIDKRCRELTKKFPVRR